MERILIYIFFYSFSSPSPFEMLMVIVMAMAMVMPTRSYGFMTFSSKSEQASRQSTRSIWTLNLFSFVDGFYY